MIAAIVAVSVVAAWLGLLVLARDRRILSRPVLDRRIAERAVVVYRDVYGDEVEITDEFRARMLRYAMDAQSRALEQMSQAFVDLARAFSRAVIPVVEWHRRWSEAIERSRDE